SRRTRRREARLHGPDRRALAGDRRPAWNRRRHSGAEEPPHRRASGPERRIRLRETGRVILNRYERMVARRYLLPGKGEGFIFLVASISLVAVMLGVAALIVVMSVMTGFRAELFDKIIGLNGHAVVQGYGGRLPDWREVVQQA